MNDLNQDANPVPHIFRVLTYNIWMDAFKQEERTIAILQTIEQLKNEDESPLLAVAFQEVTAVVLQQIKAYMTEIGYKMAFDDDKDNTNFYNKPYFDVIFVRAESEIIASGIKLFKGTTQGRTLSWVTLKYTGEDNYPPLTFETAHLESLPANQALRISQLNSIQNSHKGVLSPDKFHHNQNNTSIAYIFMGDTNMHEYNDHLIANPWHDVWVEIGDSVDKYTYDAVNNKYVKERPRSHSARFDRVYYYGGVRPIKYDLVGKIPYCLLYDGTANADGGFCEAKTDDEFLEMSDHYGVCVKFEIL